MKPSVELKNVVIDLFESISRGDIDAIEKQAMR
jgi:hypothetical protein